MATCNYSYIMFFINNVSGQKWDHIIDQVTKNDLTTPVVKYILLCKNKNTNTVIGLIECTSSIPCHTLDQLQYILSIENIKSWRECNYFRYLINFHNVLHIIAAYRARFIYKHHVQAGEKLALHNDVNVTGITCKEIHDLFNYDTKNPVMILVIEERKKNCEVKTNNAVLSRGWNWSI